MGIEADGLVIVLGSTLNLTQADIGVAPAVVGLGIPGVEANGLVIVLDGTLELTELGIGDAPDVVDPPP